MSEKSVGTQGPKVALICVVGFLPIVILSAYLSGTSITTAIVLSLVAAGLGLIGAFAFNAPVKPLLGVALIGQCAAFTASMAGQPWQLDSHMVFFAALAILVVLRDIPTILAATAAIAVHHLSFSVFFPAMVYPSAELAGNLGRTALHAVVVLAEAAALCFAIKRQNILMDNVKEQSAEIEAAIEDARVAAKERETLQAHQSLIIQKLSEGLSRLAKGDLTRKIEVDVDGEFEVLKTDFDATIDQLTALLNDVFSSTQAISEGSDNLSSTSSQLATRTEQQAASLAETTTTLTQLKESVTSTAQNVNDANDMANATRALAEDGTRIVSETVDAMHEIKNGSDEIATIILTIEDIAFQTNLLALNAGVEAARAGPSGQGFAVVASEVGALAQRSGQAAKEIAALIKATQNKVDGGVNLTEKANDALKTISEKITSVSDAVIEIKVVSRIWWKFEVGVISG
ncbi:MAG: methyl-accepting chemotaxis protein [Litoreibacter sp.]|nr:methyl-accepting chemotaxis protein [Litoreibacter sp.]MCY4336555.1 methyl-accepting chemotaxis protein [Litoreibacter sp.]